MTTDIGRVPCTARQRTPFASSPHSLSSSRGSEGRGEWGINHHSKTDIDVPDIWIVPITRCTTHTVFIVAECTSTQHAEVAIRFFPTIVWSVGIDLSLAACPLPYVACHVQTSVQTYSLRVLSDHRCVTDIVVEVAAIFIGRFIPPRPYTAICPPCSFLPFGFAG
jgi:hypothetical protein